MPGTWSYSYSGNTYQGTGCANPDGDTSGNWCPIMSGSCRGVNTLEGLPLDSAGVTLDYDYCGTGAGSLYAPGWSSTLLATVRATIADANETTGWDANLTLVPAPPPPSAPPACPATCGSNGCPYSCQVFNPGSQKCVGAESSECPCEEPLPWCDA